jgi:hypothetical protein
MFCTACGNEASMDWKHCPNCGASIANAPASEAASLKPKVIDSRDDELESKDLGQQKVNKTQIQITLGVVVITLLAFAAYINFQGSNNRQVAESNLQSNESTIKENVENASYALDKAGLTGAAVACTSEVINANDFTQEFNDLNQWAEFSDGIYRAIGSCIPSKNPGFICWENENGVPACNWDKNSVQGYLVSWLDGVDESLKAAGAQWLQD